MIPFKFLTILLAVLVSYANSDVNKSISGKKHISSGIPGTKQTSENTNLSAIDEQSMNSSQWMSALCSAEGSVYAELRDALLQDSTALADFLNQRPASVPDTSILSIHYEIISGWKNNGEQFKKYLSEIKSIDFETEKKKVTGVPGVWRKYANVAKKEYGNLILPLCWEVLLKFGNDWDSWIMNIFITAIEYIPDSKSIEPLLKYMEKTTDLPQHRFAGTRLGYLVSSLSIPEFTERLEIIRTKNASVIEGIDEALDVIKSEEERKK